MKFQRSSSSKLQFLPEALKIFIRKRITEAMGLSLIVGGSILCLSLWSYDKDDPSLNTAVNGTIQNSLGIWGSHLADFFFQYLGSAGNLVIVFLLGWGIQLILHRRLFPVKLKILSFAISLLFISMSLQTMGIYAGIIGVFFDSLLEKLYNYHPSLKWLSLSLFLSMGILTFLYSLSITRREWKNILGFVFAFVKKRTEGFLRIASSLSPLIRKGALNFKKESPASPIPLRQEPKLFVEPQAGNFIEPFKNISEEDEYFETPSASPLIYDEPLFESEKNREGVQEIQLVHHAGDYQLPPLNLLQPAPVDSDKTLMTKAELERNAIELKKVLEDFGIRGDVVSVRPGPVVTLYELVPAPGIKASRIISLADDIARSMSAISARVAVIPGKNAIGIELPNTKRQTVYLRDLFSDRDYEEAGDNLSLVIGKDISGQGIIQDLARMPHLLVAGTTGSGKSVSMNAMILSLLFKLTPDQCRLIMIDPKMLEFSIYDGIPHLLTPVVTDPKKAIVALKWVVREMENRYRSMSELGVRNIQGYNAKLKEARDRGEALKRRVQTGFDPDTGKPTFEDQILNTTHLPNIVVVVDEMADLMLVAGKEVEGAIQRLAQMARAAGIHIIMATQRPSVDVITGTIKANFPTRISFQVTSKIDSRTILGEGGAEQLLGQGDMLFMAGGGRITRIHGPFVSDKDVDKIVNFLKAQGLPKYVNTVTEDSNEPSLLEVGEKDEEGDDLFAQAVDIVRKERKASTSFIQRCLQIGYNRAARLIEQMEKEGIVSTANHVGRREVLIPPLNNQA